MDKIRLGKTNLMVSKLGFGGAPLERASEDEALAIIRKCLDFGITFFDTAAEYHSEDRVSKAIVGQREKLVISTKCECKDSRYVEKSLKQSLRLLGGYIDLYQFHDISDLETYEKATDPRGPLAVLQEAKKAGQVKHIGISSHSLEVAKLAIQSGIFETIMFALNFVYCQAVDELFPLVKKHDVGFIAMKPLGAGRLVHLPIAFKFLAQFPDIATVVGMEKLNEIDEIMQVLGSPLTMTQEEQREMLRIRAEQSVKQAFYLR
jgi:aryl-alcohol dehydrogenase-like predicted oxidoreductase